MSDALRIVVGGLIGQYPLGGVTWDYLQYVLGLRRLGHDVYYVEDTGQWPYDPSAGGLSSGPEFSAAYLDGLMRRFGLEDRWAYCFPWKRQWMGMDDRRREAVLRTADLVINVSGTLARPEEYRRRARLVYIDSDPVFTQAKIARGQRDFRRLVDAHDVHFSFGEALSVDVPVTGHRWRPTRQPVVLEQWPGAGQVRDAFTTVMNWTSYKPVVCNGTTLGQKDVEFERFLDLPRRVGSAQLEVALAPGKTRRSPRSMLRHRGWRVRDPAEACPDPDRYRDYVQGSLGEWSVAKNGYVRPGSGWFSCRSACYLAAGRPVILQDTGYSAVLPTGEGLLSFATLDEAAEAVREVRAHSRRHAGAAREIGREYFDSDRVLSVLIGEALD